MIPALEALPTTSWPERLEALRDLLSCDAPVPEAAARRAFADDRYASLLVLSRGNAALLETLFRARANERFLADPAPASKPPGTVGLAVKAGVSLARWAAGAFATLPAEEAEERLKICETCPMLRAPPSTLAYGLKLSSEVDMRVCGACGCVARRKARLPHERCPEGRWPVPTNQRASLGDPR